MKLTEQDLLAIKQSCESLLFEIKNREELFSNIAFYSDNKNCSGFEKFLGVNEENKVLYPIDKELTREILQTMLCYYQKLLPNF